MKLNIDKTTKTKNRSSGRKLFLTTVSVIALFCSAPALADPNFWTGAAGNNDLFDVDNWSDGEGPLGDESTINNGNAVGVIDLTDQSSSDLIGNIGVVTGANASVTVNIITDKEEEDDYQNVDLYFGENLIIGANGGTGTLTVNLDGPVLAEFSAENITLGSGQNSFGTINLLGTGKPAGFSPEGPIDGDCYSCASNFIMEGMESFTIGAEGGTGVLNLEGATLAFEERGQFIVGSGTGSNGTINILAGGKLGDNSPVSSPDEDAVNYGMFTVGYNGGQGTVNVDGSNAPTRENAPIAVFGQGMIIGQGSESTGSINMLSKGKVHSYINEAAFEEFEYLNVPRSEMDTRLGVDGGNGTISVSGSGSVWYQSGVFDDEVSPGNEIMQTDSGALRVGESGIGELIISNGGVVRIGSATLVSEYNEETETEPFFLTNHVSDGTLHLAIETGSEGFLSIGGAKGKAASAAGRLMAKTIQFGQGEGTILFNHIALDYVFDQFNDQYGTGPSTPTSIDIVGTGTIDAASGRTLLINNQLGFTGELRPTTGILQVTGDISSATVDIQLAGTLEGTGFVGDTVNSGTIAPGRTPDNSQGLLSSIGTLTIRGNYAGTGGILTLDTVLGGDNSLTDKLIITGNTTGSTNVQVTNIDGSGAQTIEGIRIIEVGGTSAGTFGLLGDYVHEGEQAVVGGAYAYKLYQGGVSTPSDGDWYLRSQLKPLDPIDPVDPEVPLYQAGVPTYEAYPQALLGLNSPNTLQQRIDKRFWAGNGNRVIAQGADSISPYATPEEAGVHVEGNGVWGRIEGAHNHIEPRFSTSGTDFNQNIFKMQAGVDGVMNENETGTLIGGVFVQYAHGKTKTYSVHGNGEISTDGYGVGGTLTWYGNDGFYTDGQAQVTWYNSDLNSILSNSGLTDSNDSMGYALSLESGKRFALTPDWSLTPQAQLVYSSVDFDTFNDAFGAQVSLDKGRSLQGRLGMSLDHETSWQNEKGLTDRAHIYGIANLYYEFLNGTKVNVEDVSLASKKDRLWGGLGLGGSYNWDNDKYSIYGEGLVDTSLNNFGNSYVLKGNLGLRMKW